MAEFTSLSERQAKGLIKQAGSTTGPSALSRRTVFIARNEGKMRETEEELEEPQDALFRGGTVQHSRPGTVIMWKPTPQGFFPRVVSVTSILMNLQNGWSDVCPDCEGQHSADPNECPNREPTKLLVCPVCRKRIYDNLGVKPVEVEDDPNVIPEAYEASTPESRTKVQLDLHMWMRHPRTAQMMNVPPLPVAMREMIEEARPV